MVWRNLRAAAELGWDFSSRWLADGRTLATLRTLDLLPPDLNSLLAQLERTLAKAYSLKGDTAKSAVYTMRANVRTAAIQRLMWDAQAGVFTDYLWEQGKRTRAVTAATMLPLFLRLATPAQAQAVADTVSHRLLSPGGLATSLIESGQQWDAPNGWAPLQWMAVIGLRNYGFDALAETIATRWVGENIAGYEKEESWLRNIMSPLPAATRGAAANMRPRSASAGPTVSCWPSAVSIPPFSGKSTALCLLPSLRCTECPLGDC